MTSTDDSEHEPDDSEHEKVVKATGATESTMRPQRIPVNAYEAPEAFVVIAPLPAVIASDVAVELRRHSLRISARLRSSGVREYVVHEWEYGGYEREIDLPPDFGAGLESSLTNGQLVVRVLKGAFIRQISIQPKSL